MDNVLFYTLSTIAQTLAAAIALLGALVLYRLQRISEALDLGMSQVRQPYVLNADAQLALEEERYSDVLDYLKTVQPDMPGFLESASYKGRKKRVDTLLSFQRELRLWLNVSLALTVIVIGAAVCGIALVPWITRSSIAPAVTLTLAVVAFVACLIVYACLARKTVQ